MFALGDVDKACISAQGENLQQKSKAFSTIKSVALGKVFIHCVIIEVLGSH